MNTQKWHNGLDWVVTTEGEQQDRDTVWFLGFGHSPDCGGCAGLSISEKLTMEYNRLKEQNREALAKKKSRAKKKVKK